MNEKGATIRVTVSDPWDFTSATGSNVFEANIVDRQASAVLLHLVTPLERDGRFWYWFVADSPRGDRRLYGVPDDARDGWTDAAKNWRGQTPSARATLAVHTP